MSNTLLRDVSLALFLAGTLTAVRAEAGEPGCQHWPITRWFGQVGGCCPNDYCPKPLPAIECCPEQCCPDNYCKKPLPELPCRNCGHSCECYHKKPLTPLQHCCEPWYKCIPYCGGK